MRSFHFILILLFFIISFMKGLELDEASYNFAEKLLSQKKYAQALDEFDRFTGKFPDSHFFNKALMEKARIYYILKNYDKSISCYTALENNAVNDTDRKTAVFGKGENYYRLKNWAEAAESFKRFAFNYKSSPVHHAALYYAGKSYEYLNRYPEARVFFECLVLNYPSSPYYAEAEKELTAENIVKLTDVIINPVTESEPAINTGQNVLPSNDNKKKQEEIRRYEELIELKAKLLDLKEKAINEKKDILYETNINSNLNLINVTNVSN